MIFNFQEYDRQNKEQDEGNPEIFADETSFHKKKKKVQSQNGKPQ